MFHSFLFITDHIEEGNDGRPPREEPQVGLEVGASCQPCRSDCIRTRFRAARPHRSVYLRVTFFSCGNYVHVKILYTSGSSSSVVVTEVPVSRHFLPALEELSGLFICLSIYPSIFLFI